MQDMDQHDRLLSKPERLALAGVLCVLGFAMLLSGCWSGCPSCVPPFVPQDAPTALQVQQKRVIDAMQGWYPVAIDAIEWKHCGTNNSYYYPAHRKVQLCTDMEEAPEAGVFFAAHEVAHGATWQLAGTLDEDSADEVGALAMIKLDMTAELLGASKYFMDKRDARHVRWDGHPSDTFRAWQIACLAEGSFEDGDPECRALYTSTRDRWDLRLRSPQVDPFITDAPPLEVE